MDPALLAQIPLFSELRPDHLERVAEACSEVDVEEGTTLLREGDFGYSLFAITSGTAEVIEDGTVLRKLAPGDVFGEIAALSSGRRTATVVATSRLGLVTVFNRDLWKLEHNAPDVIAALRKTITKRLGRPATARA